MQIAGKLHRGFIPVREGSGDTSPDGATSHSQSKISPVAIKGGRESDCECMSQTTATDSRPQKNDQGSTTACHGVLKRSRESRDFPFFFAYLFEVLAANPP